MRGSWCDGVEKLEETRPSLPEGVHDGGLLRPRQPRRACGGHRLQALTEAVVLVLILLLLFLGDLRAALVVALILPLSVLATFILMRPSACRPT